MANIVHPTTSLNNPTNPTNPSDYVPPKQPMMKRREPAKAFGIELRALGAVLGITLFFVLAMAGVVISLRQRFVKQSVAPNAPESRPLADVVRTSDCSLTFDVLTSYDCNTTCETNIQCQSVNADYVCATTDDGSRCRLGSNITSEICEPPEVVYECNSTCTTDAECRTANDNYVCYQDTDGQFCRLSSNLTEETCVPLLVTPTPTPSVTPTPTPTPTPSPTPSPAPSVTPTPSPTPSPAPGCNDACVTNADCSNPDHICYTNVCRLADYVESTTCTPPASTVVQAQPELPAELPETGSEDILNWLKAGLGVLGIGAILLLLL